MYLDRHLTTTVLRCGNGIAQTKRLDWLKLILTATVTVTLMACNGVGSKQESDTATNTTGPQRRDTASATQQEPVTFSQADAAGLWTFTIRTVNYTACYNSSGKRESSDLAELPTTLSVNATGAVSGKHVKSGGSGATTWTGTTSYTGQMSDDKMNISGTQNYRRTGMSGVSTSSDDFTAVKIETVCGTEADTGVDIASDTVVDTAVSVDTNSGSVLDTGSATGVDTATVADTGSATEMDTSTVVDTGSATEVDTATVVDTQPPVDTATLTDTQSDTGTVAVADSDTGSETVPVDTDTSPENLEEAAEAMAKVHCDRHDECLPGDFDIIFGEFENCITGAERRYIWEAAMPGAGWTIEQFEACMTAMLALSCEDRNSRTTVVPECHPAGTVAVGESCLANAQCATGFCNTANLECGICAELPPAGSECLSHGQCAPGQQCVLGVCTVPQGSLGSCTDWAGCDYGFSCVDGICRAEATALGDACDPTDGTGLPWCSEEGLICAMTDNECRILAHAVQGQSCGWLTSDVYTNCSNNIGCGTDGKCGAPPVPGDACGEDHNGSLPLCRWPDTCSQGECRSLPVYAQTCTE